MLVDPINYGPFRLTTNMRGDATLYHPESQRSLVVPVDKIAEVQNVLTTQNLTAVNDIFGQVVAIAKNQVDTETPQ